MFRIRLVTIALFLPIYALAAAHDPMTIRVVTAAERAVQMRVRVFYPGGTTLFDSDWKGGNIVDLTDLPYGSYQLRIWSRDLEGRVAERLTTLQVSADRITVDPALPDDLKLTTTAHDGTTGQLITTSGDLSFRFGDYLKGKDNEAMRLSPEGNLDVKGWIRPAQGILFPDGSVLTSAFVDESGRTRASRGSTTDTKKLTPRIEASGTGTMNQIAKWIDSAGTLGDSIVTESVSGNIGIGTTSPSGKLHIFGGATADVFAGMGVDMVAGPAFNFGYGGASFGRSAGFFNVRPDGSAVAPNPSLRFLTGNVERMIVTNAGNIGIGTSTPGGKLQVFAAPTADVFAGFGTDMSVGPSMNFGYGGATFGRGAGFFNARPDASAVAPNPSLRFMTNNLERMIVTDAGNVGIGMSAPSQRLDVAGSVNIAANLSLPATAAGGTAGVITLGGNRFAHNFGTENMFLGSNAGNFTMTGIRNTAVGNFALGANTTGCCNMAGGRLALISNTTGSENTSIGDASLANNTSGFSNTAEGRGTLINNTTGCCNTGSGYQTLSANTTGNSNIAVGFDAGFTLTTGDNNIEIGNQGVAAEANTIRIGTAVSAAPAFLGVHTRTFIAAIRGVTPGAADGQGVLIDSNGQLGTIGNVTFSNNLGLPATASGGTAGVITLGGAPFLQGFGTNNTFLGPNAGNFTMSGGGNTGIGDSALTNNTFGLQNTAVGWTSMQSNSNGYSNTAVGWETLKVSSSGGVNTAIGNRALMSNTTGSDNTALGGNALENNTNGSNNIAVGFTAGGSIVAGNYNIDIGSSGPGDESNTIRIGNAINHGRAFIAGIRNVITGNQDAIPVLIDSVGQLGTISSSRRYKFDIADMRDATDGLMRLRPVTFRYLAHGANARLQYGLIAEEVADVYPELVALDKDGQPETVMYQFLAPMLLNEVQKQQRTIQQQQAQLDAEHAENAALRARVERLEKFMDAQK